MSNCHRGISNARLRGLIDGYIRDCMPDTRLDVYDLMRTLSNGRRRLDSHRISLFLRERQDLEHIGTNEWRVRG
jgi:hypothetical protein